MCSAASCVGGPCSASVAYVQGLPPPSNGSEWAGSLQYNALKGALGAPLHHGSA